MAAFCCGGYLILPAKTGWFFLAENMFVLKLSDGSDILAALEKFAKENKIGYGMFMGGSGKLKNFELSSTQKGAGVAQLKSDKEFGLEAVSGKIQTDKNGKVTTDIHLLITSSGFTPKSGQLVKGKASKGLEISIRKMGTKKMIEA